MCAQQRLDGNHFITGLHPPARQRQQTRRPAVSEWARHPQNVTEAQAVYPHWHGAAKLYSVSVRTTVPVKQTATGDSTLIQISCDAAEGTTVPDGLNQL